MNLNSPTLAAAVILSAAVVASAQTSAPATRPGPRIAYPWSPDQGDGTYRNPIICADYSDPDVVRDGDDFWLTASSFTCTPGLPILHSRDLVNWTIVNHAIDNLPDPRGVFNTVRHGEGVWAPSIRKHAGKFWIFFPMPDEGIYVTSADDPRKQWSPPQLLLEGKGLIDPCPLWDDDGKAYLVHAYAGSRAGIKNILRVRPILGRAFLPGDDQSLWDITGEYEHRHYINAQRDTPGLVAPLPGVTGVGVGRHPLLTLIEPVRFTGEEAKVGRRIYVFAESWQPTPFAGFHAKVAADPAWEVHRADASHNVMGDQPEQLLALMLAQAR